MFKKTFWAVAFLLLPFSIYANITIAVFDTGFCIDRLSRVLNIEINKPHWTRGKYQVDCQRLSKKQTIYHGHYVLKELLDGLKVSHKVTIIPIVIYNSFHKQSYLTWKNGLDLAHKSGATILLSANGLPSDKDIELTLLKLNFLASGQIGRKINRHTKLFPQALAKKDNSNIILVGSYYPLTDGDKRLIKDPSMIYQDYIDLYTLPKKLSGSSGAVAKALNIALKKCFNLLQEGDKEKLVKCLNEVTP
jgi:hypothetical protein